MGELIDRVTVLGGGSVYIPEFVLSLITHNVHVKEIVLYNRPGEKLKTVAAFCRRLVKKTGYPLEVVASTDLEEAVTGAKYVLNHIRVGGMRGRIRDEKLPVEFGMIGDESLGAGGLTNAMRTLPVVLEMVKRIEAVNPDCTFINLTNPMGTVVEALIKRSKLNVIGVCDLPGEYSKKVASILRRDASDLYIDYIGLNHMGWIQDVRMDKQSCMSTVLDRIEDAREDGFDYDLIDLFRMIPTLTVSLYFHSDRLLKEQRNCTQFRAEALHEAEKQILTLYRDKRVCEIPALTRERNTVWYEETIIPLILALESQKTHNLILCVGNHGAIRDLPDDCSVEVPVEVSRNGLKPRKVGDCPHFLKGLFVSVKESDRRVVEAVIHKSYEYALQALTINPLVPSLDTAKKYLDRVIADESFELH